MIVKNGNSKLQESRSCILLMAWLGMNSLVSQPEEILSNVCGTSESRNRDGMDHTSWSSPAPTVIRSLGISTVTLSTPLSFPRLYYQQFITAFTLLRALWPNKKALNNFRPRGLAWAHRRI